MLVFALALSLTLAADEPDTEMFSAPPQKLEEHLVPPFVPRAISFGILINSPMVTPNVRLDWNIDLYASSTHNFFALGTVGSGFGAALPVGMTAHYQHTLMVGFGYRNATRVIHWGFQFGVGPVWYRAFFAPTQPYASENKVLGYAEGRLQAGYQLAPHLLLGVYFGFGSPWTVDTTGRYPGNIYIGGLAPGLYLEWN
jgi:hypothetical protein